MTDNTSSLYKIIRKINKRLRENVKKKLNNNFLIPIYWTYCNSKATLYPDLNLFVFELHISLNFLNTLGTVELHYILTRIYSTYLYRMLFSICLTDLNCIFKHYKDNCDLNLWIYRTNKFRIKFIQNITVFNTQRYMYAGYLFKLTLCAINAFVTPATKPQITEKLIYAVRTTRLWNPSSRLHFKPV